MVQSALLVFPLPCVCCVSVNLRRACAQQPAALFPNREVRVISIEILKIYILGWAAAGFFGVLLGYWLTSISGINYSYDTGVEASAPKVWNMVLMFGLGVIILASIAGMFGPNRLNSILYLKGKLLES
ncbi:hypothetical protein [Rheinheimera soli]|uniref:FtsX-like permease family protein n=1 Tax=Rheinheimera soli TaxID=443616 RepID=A0ABU1W562_9GAMM|nr:hypothetical protein [Rheinheimera soli]MDR7123111.1 hypothetical protein [Rheinheimera soli]